MQAKKEIFCFRLFFDNRSNAQSASKMGENSSIEKYLQKMFSLISEWNDSHKFIIQIQLHLESPQKELVL